MEKIRIGGVPEHFNLPWHLAIERGLFHENNIEVEWITYKGGTGAMTKALKNNEADLCILLTEGIVADILNGNPSKIISSYVTSPLVWGIHTGMSNKLERHADIYDKTYAISRFGSGSHLMPQVDAFYKKKEILDKQFRVINNLEGALASLGNEETDVFYWEKFTTKPYVDQGLLKRIGEYPTPWPCFVIAASDQVLNRSSSLVKQVLNTIHKVNKDFMNDPESAIMLVAERYEQNAVDVKAWFQSTSWAINDIIASEVLDRVIFTLKNAGVLHESQNMDFNNLVMKL